MKKKKVVMVIVVVVTLMYSLMLFTGMHVCEKCENIYFGKSYVCDDYEYCIKVCEDCFRENS